MNTVVLQFGANVEFMCMCVLFHVFLTFSKKVFIRSANHMHNAKS